MALGAAAGARSLTRRERKLEAEAMVAELRTCSTLDESDTEVSAAASVFCARPRSSVDFISL
jgi:hypothetical protein